MANSVKLTYFNVQGLGETIRLVLHAAKVEYEDVRINNFDDWKPLKESTPFGQLPLMNIDGIELAQSASIVRYCARKYGLAGDGEQGFVLADIILEHVRDYIKEIMKLRWCKTPKEKQQTKPTMILVEGHYGDKQQLAEDFLNKFLPSWLANAEKWLNKQGGKWFSSDKLTFGDLAFHHAIFWLSWKDERAFEGVTGCEARFTMLDKYPALKENFDRVSNIPEIKAYMEARPAASQQVNGWGL